MGMMKMNKQYEKGYEDGFYDAVHEHRKTILKVFSRLKYKTKEVKAVLKFFGVD